MPIEVEHLSYVYGQRGPDPVVALEDVSLRIEDGQFVAIIGSTGSGKSTLIQHFNGLIRPQRGRVVVDGLDLGDRRTRLLEVRRRVGLVMQYPENQLFEETVLAEVGFGPRNLGLSDEEVRTRSERALQAVGVAPALWSRSPFELSGGEMRRVAIASILAMEPRTLVLDEPTAGLDPRGRRQILEQIRQFHRGRGMTVVLVTHNMEDVARLAERVFVLHRGRLVLSGPTREVYAEGERLRAWGLAPPQVAQVLAGLRACGYDVRSDRITVEEARDEILRLWEGGR
ncbi:MAG: energy-coupling factor transporter ATPase [Clostridia bacterium]|nr:energy-coupling factor transporter ATPase [Clostridia bacterium]MCL6521229.1 energy-coupling factor transporter ATPase [Bacillota bacterium]